MDVVTSWGWLSSPHDGRNATLAGAGVPLMRQYADAGLDMMHEAACFKDGGRSVEAGVLEMADRMRGKRWKVFRGQNDAWMQEVATYHLTKTACLSKNTTTPFQRADTHS